MHKRKFIYRGLKPSNVILNVSNHIILIDFDGMINENGCNSEFARDIFKPHEFEYEDTILTSKSDIYSILKMMYYILFEEIPKDPFDELFKQDL